MPFFIPVIAIGSGVGLVIWGVRKIWNNDDSADKFVAEFIKEIPSYIEKYIESVEFNDGEFKVKFKAQTPTQIKQDFENNIESIR